MKHIEDVLMVLFLLEAAKKTDRAFHAAPQSSSHTVRNFNTDLDIMVKHLQEKRVAENITGRNNFTFLDPVERGWQKLCTTPWLRERISAMHHQDDEGDIPQESGEVELEYELYL